MPRSLSVHLLPSLVEPSAMAGSPVVVIDVLRASTTITWALAAGARAVYPCLEVDDARRRAANLGAGAAVLGGEREGLRIEGFALGNSPEEYTEATVGGKDVVFTTTNGTRAVARCEDASRVLIGAFVNARAVADELQREPAVHLLCAGTRGEVTREDALLAGLLVGHLAGGDDAVLNDQARLVRDAWRAAFPGDDPEPARLADELRRTQGGRNVALLGLDKDIEAAARLDCFHLVPVLDRESGALRLT